MAASPQLSYLALGDSYTCGEGVAQDGCWPSQLAAALRGEGVPLADPRIIANTGWTTDELEWGIDAAEPPCDWDFVSLLIGVNNQYRNRSAVDYAEGFRTLLSRSLKHAGGHTGRVLVLSIPDWGVTPFARSDTRPATTIAAEIDAFNAAAQQACAQHAIAFVDVTAVSRERGADPAMLVADGLHPSSAMYAEWTRLALPVARRLLA